MLSVIELFEVSKYRSIEMLPNILVFNRFAKEKLIRTACSDSSESYADRNFSFFLFRISNLRILYKSNRLYNQRNLFNFAT